MLKKQNRLRRLDVEKTFKNGSFFRGKACIIRALPSPITRAAIAVPKKVAKTAVVRNKLRRYIYTLCERNPKFLLLQKDIVFAVTGTDTATIQNDIDSYFEQLTK
jgi:ribonuclease P protein component